MSAQVITQVRTSNANSRGQGRPGNSNRRARGGNNTDTPSNRGSNNRNARGNKEKKADAGANIPENDDTKPTAKQQSTAVVAAPQSETGDLDICWICAEPVKYYSLSECNHRTCHVCAIRLRALYKKTDCTFCKVSGGGACLSVLY